MTLSALTALLDPIASAYNDAPLVQAATTFAHFAGLLLGGGFAIATDWATLRARTVDAVERRRQLALIHAAHRPVVGGLALAFASGALMFVGDYETLATSPAFWAKMGIVALLLANGGVMARTETALRAAAPDESTGWRRLGLAAACSLTLWFAAVLAGTLLVNPTS